MKKLARVFYVRNLTKKQMVKFPVVGNFKNLYIYVNFIYQTPFSCSFFISFPPLFSEFFDVKESPSYVKQWLDEIGCKDQFDNKIILFCVYIFFVEGLNKVRPLKDTETCAENIQNLFPELDIDSFLNKSFLSVQCLMLYYYSFDHSS